MKFKFLMTILASLVLSASCLVNVANAGLITVDDWHLTTGPNAGLTQSRYSDDIFFAISKNTYFDHTAEYEMLDGYHQATWDEYTGVVNEYISSFGYLPSDHVHHNNFGWSGYSYEGETRYYFNLADTTQVNGQSKYHIHAGNHDSYTNLNYYQANSFTQWAGFILVKDEVNVPEPSTLAIFALGIMGLASRRFKKQA
jgi:hypothetical protein